MFLNISNSFHHLAKKALVFLCLFLFSLLMLFVSTAHWTHILSEVEGVTLAEKKLTTQHSIIELTVFKNTISKHNLNFKRLNSVFKKQAFKEEFHKNIEHRHQPLLKCSCINLFVKLFLGDRSFDRLKLSILSSKHHPPT